MAGGARISAPWPLAAPATLTALTALAALATLATLLPRAAALQVLIAVVEPSPALALQVAAAVDAALAADAAAAGEEEAPGAAAVAPAEPDEPLAVPAHVCALGAAHAALGGGGGAAAALGAAAAARAGVPLLLLHAAPPAAMRAGALALRPPPAVLARAVAALCRDKGWTRAVLLHEGDARAAALLTRHYAQLALAARRLPPPGDDALLRNLLLVLKKSGESDFIVWCDAARALEVLRAAQRVGLLSERHSYVVASLDLHTQPLADVSHGGANVTALALFDLEREEVRDVAAAWRAAYAARLGDALNVTEATRVQAAPPSALLLAHAAATRVARALRHLALPDVPQSGAGCGSGAGAFHGDTLLNYLRSTEPEGAPLHVTELARGGWLRHAGVWAPAAGLEWRRRPRAARPLPHDSMTNRTFTVLIAKNDPYVMRSESTERLTGNNRYEGFCIELIERLAALLHFNYTFVEHTDGGYGTYNETTKLWDGMTRRLMDDPLVDFAITDLTITAERERAVDFTTPFMNLGISILFRKSKPPEPKAFAFMLPFSDDVWMWLALAYVGSSLVLFVAGRLCPEEWQNPYPCVEEPVALENQFTLVNAFWFNLGAMLLQGSEIAPVAYGTRAVGSAWWVFALVITSSYTANLATLLAKKTSTDIIHDVRELADNDLDISYGAKLGGSTYTFFEHSQSDLYGRMFQHMKNQTMPLGNPEGILKVKMENYAFLMESTTIEYTVERDCAVTMVGELLDSKGYGIAMKKGSPYRQELNLALLNLQEAGVLREMKETWWREKHGGGACKEVDDRENTKLAMRNFLGLWLVLVVGCALGVVLSLADLARAAWRRRAPQPFHRRLAAELRFVFAFHRSVKPLQGSLDSSPSGSSRCSPDEAAAEAEAAAAVEAAVEAEAEAAAEAAAQSRRGSARRARRRSSMHTAQARLARHAEPPAMPH